MSQFNTFQTYPLIPNANQYFFEKKYISIHSEDRDLLRYPNSAEFEIELPQDYLNVASARLYSWSFPANYSVFSILNSNIAMTFKFTSLYNPGDFFCTDLLTEAIYNALYNQSSKEYVITIEPGFYNPEQMAIELTNKFNEVITLEVIDFLNSPDGEPYASVKDDFTGYDRFIIVYNTVSQKLWFGNTADKFLLTNDSTFIFKREFLNTQCLRERILPETSNWGLPAYLGFTPCSTPSLSAAETVTILGGITPKNTNANVVPTEGDGSYTLDMILLVPRFYYGDVTGSGDNGYWLLPKLPGATVYFLQAPAKINFMGPAYIYMDVDGLNCIDETSPYYINEYALHTNVTNGIVNSSFAKIPVPTTPISQWFDTDMAPYKYFNPPAERIRKLKLRFRYHNGQTVQFGTFEYSFMLEFNLLTPQQERNYSIRNAFELSQNQSFSK